MLTGQDELLIQKDDEVGRYPATWREEHRCETRAMAASQTSNGSGHIRALGQFELLAIKAGVLAQYVVVLDSHGDHTTIPSLARRIGSTL